KDVDRAEALKRGLRHGLRRLFAGDVGCEPYGLEPLRGKRLGHGFRRRAVDVRGNNPGARLGEFLGIDFADPFAAAGDDDGTAGQIKALVHVVPRWIKRGRTHAPFGVEPSRARIGSSNPRCVTTGHCPAPSTLTYNGSLHPGCSWLFLQTSNWPRMASAHAPVWRGSTSSTSAWRSAAARSLPCCWFGRRSGVAVSSIRCSSPSPPRSPRRAGN